MSIAALLSSDQVVALRANASSFIGKLTGEEAPYFHINPEKLSRQWLRRRMLDIIAYKTLYKSKAWDAGEVFKKCSARHVSAIDKFIEENLELIAEIQMEVAVILAHSFRVTP